MVENLIKEKCFVFRIESFDFVLFVPSSMGAGDFYMNVIKLVSNVECFSQMILFDLILLFK